MNVLQSLKKELKNNYSNYFQYILRAK